MAANELPHAALGAVAAEIAAPFGGGCGGGGHFWPYGSVASAHRLFAPPKTGEQRPLTAYSAVRDNVEEESAEAAAGSRGAACAKPVSDIFVGDGVTVTGAFVAARRFASAVVRLVVSAAQR